MQSKSTYRTIFAALFAALTCVATMFIRVPSPIGGYINLGDGIVLLCGFMLGPVYGALAAGIGSMMADILAGYPVYAIGTLIIKAVMAFVAGVIYRSLNKDKESMTGHVVRIIAAGLCAEIIMVFGYFFYSAVCLSYGMGAAIEIPGNAIQGSFGIVIACVLTPALAKSNSFRKMKVF